MSGESTISLDQAVDLTRTGDLWLFRGDSAADRAIRALTNAPVNHVGMAVVLDDPPPLMWHAELGRGLLDVWTGNHHRGVQLHDLREAVVQWSGRYEQRPWMRQLSADITPEREAAVLTTIARPGRTVGAGSGPPCRGRRGDLLRRGGRRDLHRDGVAPGRPPHELLRPRKVLVGRRPRAPRRRDPLGRDPGPGQVGPHTRALSDPSLVEE